MKIFLVEGFICADFAQATATENESMNELQNRCFQNQLPHLYSTPQLGVIGRGCA